MKETQTRKYEPGLIYLACPFAHPKREVQEVRVEQTNRVAADLFKLGLTFFSPLSHGNSFVDLLPESFKCEHNLWMKLDLRILEACSTLLIIPLDGWQSSRGVNQEIREFGQMRAGYYQDRVFVLGQGQWCAGRYFPGFDIVANVWEERSDDV